MGLDKEVYREKKREYNHDAVTVNSSVAEIDLKARLLIVAARSRGWNMAADNLQYYLNGNKIQKNIPRRWLRGFHRVRAAESQIHTFCEFDILDKIRSHSRGSGNETTLHVAATYYSHISYFGSGDSNEELFYASGDSTLDGSCAFQITIKGDNVTVVGKVGYKWHDTYDFHKGKCVLIPALGRIPDDAMKKLVTHGMAREYKMKSVWRQPLNTTFKIDAWRNLSSIKWDWGLAF